MSSNNNASGGHGSGHGSSGHARQAGMVVTADMATPTVLGCRPNKANSREDVRLSRGRYSIVLITSKQTGMSCYLRNCPSTSG